MGASQKPLAPAATGARTFDWLKFGKGGRDAQSKFHSTSIAGELLFMFLHFSSLPLLRARTRRCWKCGSIFFSKIEVGLINRQVHSGRSPADKERHSTTIIPKPQLYRSKI